MTRIAVVQARPTQLESPLYRMMARRDDCELHVYYTDGRANVGAYDPEMDRDLDLGNELFSGYRFTIIRSVWQRVCTLLRISGFDHVIISGYKTPFGLALAMVRRIQCRSVGLRSDNILHDRPIGTLKRIAIKGIHSLFTTGHPVGTLASEYMTRFGMPQSHIYPFPYTPDVQWIQGEYSRHRQSQTNHDSFVVLAVLKLTAREDPLTLLKAFALLRGEFPNALLLLVGDGPLRKSLETFVSSNKIQGVEFVGYVPYKALPKYFAQADVLVHPPKRESWGVTVHEALACGLPVVVSRAVGSRIDLVIPNSSGLVFETGNDVDLFNTLSWMAEHPAERRAIGDRGRSHIDLHWTFEKSINSILASARTRSRQSIPTHS